MAGIAMRGSKQAASGDERIQIPDERSESPPLSQR